MGLVDDWRNIAISLKMPEKGEWKAQTCAIACSRQLRKTNGIMGEEIEPEWPNQLLG
jgi:hypothetical protein